MRVNNAANRLAISKIIIMGAYCVLVCAAVTFSFKSMFFSLVGTESGQNDIISRETISKAGLLGSDEIIKIQTALNDLGYDVGDIDGIFGVKTQDALMRFQRACGLVADGSIEPRTLEVLEVQIDVLFDVSGDE